MLSDRYMAYLTVMLGLLLAIAVLVAAVAARAEPLPQPRAASGCPSGYYPSGSFCLPHQGASQALPGPPGGCPSGWYASGSYCLRSK